ISPIHCHYKAFFIIYPNEQLSVCLHRVYVDIIQNLVATGKHIHQITYGCEWNDETGETNVFRQTGFDGEDFMILDLKREKWISPMKQGFSAQERCNNESIRFQYWKYYLQNDCIESLKELLQLAKSYLEKTVSPQVSLLQKNASSPVLCHITDFYPSNIAITWMKNGQEYSKDVKVGKLLPNEDRTFQKTVTLKAEPDEWMKNEYSCVVKHQSKIIRKTLTENEIRTNIKTPEPVGMTVAVASMVSLLLLVIVAVLGYFIYSIVQN
ncbi:major histocompatibility complex class I-related gene protein-like, partial [Carassius auratus]|uniref:Major histocompatibility complex class I-related gene protein-like n=1 Tax=Carassius auratus TaxID=7957 RepID=A0A6P6NTV8_CARAU